MKERPILMCGDMVRATLEDRKTETRRVCNPHPNSNGYVRVSGCICDDCGNSYERTPNRCACGCEMFKTVSEHISKLPCPYGQPGDRLVVREAHWRYGRWYQDGLTKKGRPRWRFRADRLHQFACFEPPHAKPKRSSKGWHKRPGIFLPWSYSRITLEITGVRVERVQEITEEGAVAEGIEKWCPYEVCEGRGYMPQISTAAEPDFCKCADLEPGEVYSILWDSLNSKRDGGKFAWEKNPWVWVISFKKL